MIQKTINGALNISSNDLNITTIDSVNVNGIKNLTNTMIFIPTTPLNHSSVILVIHLTGKSKMAQS